MNCVGLRSQASSFDPCLFYFFARLVAPLEHSPRKLMTFWDVANLARLRNFVGFRNYVLVN